MLDHDVTRKVRVRDSGTGEVRVETRVVANGLSRRYVNKQINRVRRMFSWAVEEEILDVTVHSALARVKGLKRGANGAREKPRAKPVPPASIDGVLPLVPRRSRP